MAILTMREGRKQELTAHRHRDPEDKFYSPVSEFVSNEVISSREAVLAEDVARGRYLRQRESLAELGATSLICAPFIHDGKVLGLVHLYCTDPHRSLSAEDLEFAVAVPAPHHSGHARRAYANRARVLSKRSDTRPAAGRLRITLPV